MIKCEVVKDFTFGRFDELKNIVRRNVEVKGQLYIGDTFECDEDIAKYLYGNNERGEIVIKILEIIPQKVK